MLRLICICFVILDLTIFSEQISPKVDFGEEEITSDVKTLKTEDEDVEVKHTIVVSTKLKNNNRKLHSNDDAGGLTYRFGNKNSNDDDSGEVPIVKAYKSVETTQIRTPDSRLKTTTFKYPEFIPQNRNSRDEYDFYPNVAVNPNQWQPSSFFNNINWWNQDNVNFNGRNRPDYQKLHRRVNDDGVREFYCRKCREMNGLRGCGQQRRSSWIQENTTPKIKIDGKIAKLN